MSVLVVVSHPDDETLGCGATVASLASQGVEVFTCILSANAEARQRRPELNEFMDDLKKAHTVLGIHPLALGSFPNIELNTVPHLKLVQFIEGAIREAGATVVFTHHPHDLNDDHRHTSAACQAAVRLFQRQSGVPPLEALYFMEVGSSTDWSFRGAADPFQPDSFFEVTEKSLEQKIQALAAYRGVMRDYPHPRSRETITSLAAVRGGQAGMLYAEAFQTAFRRFSTV